MSRKRTHDQVEIHINGEPLALVCEPEKVNGNHINEEAFETVPLNDASGSGVEYSPPSVSM